MDAQGGDVCHTDLAVTFATFSAVLYLSHKYLPIEFYGNSCALMK